MHCLSPPRPASTLFPYTTLFRSLDPPAALTELAALCGEAELVLTSDSGPRHVARAVGAAVVSVAGPTDPRHTDRKSTRLNSSHSQISYAVFCLKKKIQIRAVDCD